MEKDNTEFVYLIHAEGTNRYKIGRTKNVATRLQRLNSTQSPFPLVLVASGRFSDAKKAEKELHIKWKKYRTHGEWFIFRPHQLKEVSADVQGIKFKQFPVKLCFSLFLLTVSIAVGGYYQLTQSTIERSPKIENYR